MPRLQASLDNCIPPEACDYCYSRDPSKRKFPGRILVLQYSRWISILSSSRYNVWKEFFPRGSSLSRWICGGNCIPISSPFHRGIHSDGESQLPKYSHIKVANLLLGLAANRLVRHIWFTNIQCRPHSIHSNPCGWTRTYSQPWRCFWRAGSYPQPQLVSQWQYSG